MKIRSIERNCTLAWSPANQDVLLALGTVSGALDASFSSSTELELFDINIAGTALTPNGTTATTSKSMRKVGSVPMNARFNRLAWGAPGTQGTLKNGLIAAGKENGELDLLNPHLILDGKSDKESLIARHTTHGGPVRGLDFNPLHKNLLASGASDGEISIWDLNTVKSYAPGARSQRLDNVTALSWNRQVPHILASASNSGYTVVWDLRNRKEIIQLSYPGGRKPVTSLAWNPDTPMQMVTAVDDDMNSMLLMWDLRNASAPERTFSGHSKGILSVAWCPKDSELLLSCGKDNRTIVWNTVQGEPIGDLNHSANWTFDAQWCPKNPDLIAVASFDGCVTIHSLQSIASEEPDFQDNTVPSESHIDDDPFAQVSRQQTLNDPDAPVFVLRHPPKWLCQPAGATFGFGNRLVRTKPAQGKSVVSIHTVHSDAEISQRIDLLSRAFQSGSYEELVQYCDTLSSPETGFTLSEKDREVFKFFKAMVSSTSRDDIVQMLGFDKNLIADERLSGLFKRLNVKPVLPTDEQSVTNEDGSIATKSGSKSTATPFSLFAIGKPTEDSDIDTLITKALMLSDFETAVNICLGANRLADALVLAVSGGEELLYRTQQEYFRRTSKFKPYSRILQGIVDGDLMDVVENARVDGLGGGSWKDLVALVCTYAKNDDFSKLMGMIGSRLETTGSSLALTGTHTTMPSISGIKRSPMLTASDRERNHAAILCYIGAGNFDKVVGVWCQNEPADVTKPPPVTGVSTRLPSPTHASAVKSAASPKLALQTLIEKIFILSSVVQFVDPELNGLMDGQTEYALAPLYAKYLDYASMAAHAGNIECAWRILELVPNAFTTTPAPHASFENNQAGDDNGFDTLATAQADQVVSTDPVAILRDLVYQSGGYRIHQVGSAPAFPFSPFELAKPYEEPVYTQQPANSYNYGGQSNQNQFNIGNAWAQPSVPHTSRQPSFGGYQPQQQAPTPPVAMQPSMYGGAGFQPQQQQQNTWNHSNQQSYGGNSAYGGYQGQPSFQQQQQAPSVGVPSFQPAYARSTSVPPQSNPYAPMQTMQQQPPMSRTSSVLSPPITAPAVPAKHPVGDRSHIPEGQKPCFKILQHHLDDFKDSVHVGATGSADPHLMNSYRDAEKRLGQLFDQMNNTEVPQDVAEKLLQIGKALDKSDFVGAHRIQVDLMTRRFDVCGVWIVGIKRLIESLERIKMGPVGSSHQGHAGSPNDGLVSPGMNGQQQPSLGYQSSPPIPMGANNGQRPSMSYGNNAAFPPSPSLGYGGSHMQQQPLAPPPLAGPPPIGSGRPSISPYPSTMPTQNHMPLAPPPIAGSSQHMQNAFPPTISNGSNTQQTPPPPTSLSTFGAPPPGMSAPPPTTSTFKASMPPHTQMGGSGRSSFGAPPPSQPLQPIAPPPLGMMPPIQSAQHTSTFGNAPPVRSTSSMSYSSSVGNGIAPPPLHGQQRLPAQQPYFQGGNSGAPPPTTFGGSFPPPPVGSFSMPPPPPQ
ncbi:protein transport protein S31 [Batrachochytrium dendrobatidis]